VSPSVPVAAVDTGIERQSSSRPTLFCRQPSHLCCSRVSRLRRQDCSTPLFNSHPLSSRTFSKACTYMHICGCHCMCSLHLSPPRFRRFLFFSCESVVSIPSPCRYRIISSAYLGLLFSHFLCLEVMSTRVLYQVVSLSSMHCAGVRVNRVCRCQCCLLCKVLPTSASTCFWMSAVTSLLIESRSRRPLSSSGLMASNSQGGIAAVAPVCE